MRLLKLPGLLSVRTPQCCRSLSYLFLGFAENDVMFFLWYPARHRVVRRARAVGRLIFIKRTRSFRSNGHWVECIKTSQLSQFASGNSSHFVRVVRWLITSCRFVFGAASDGICALKYRFILQLVIDCCYLADFTVCSSDDGTVEVRQALIMCSLSQ
jgi:hypothetical protein